MFSIPPNHNRIGISGLLVARFNKDAAHPRIDHLELYEDQMQTMKDMGINLAPALPSALAKIWDQQVLTPGDMQHPVQRGVAPTGSVAAAGSAAAKK
jgi:hypothetical protein